MHQILHHVAGNYWIDLTGQGSSDPVGSSQLVRLSTTASTLISGKKYSKAQIEATLECELPDLPNAFSLAYCTPRILAFSQTPFLASLTAEADLRGLEASANLRVEQYRSARWKKITDTAHATDASLEAVIAAIVSHTFHDHYSLWLYNESAEIFHLVSASFQPEIDWMHAEDPRCTLAEFHNSPDRSTSRPLRVGAYNTSSLPKIKTVTRFKIDANIPAVLSIYSEREGFTPSPYSTKVLPEIARVRLQSDISNDYIRKSRKLREIMSRYEVGAFDEFLQLVLRKICQELGWEAASVYMNRAAEGKRELSLRATWPAMPGRSPRPDSSYPIDAPSLTCTVFKSSHPVCVYDIQGDPRNSHGYDEPTTSNAKNWLGVQVAREGHPAVGVIRLKNRFASGHVVPFNSLDVKLVETIASTIGYAHHLEELHTKQQIKVQQKLEQTAQENRDLNEFIKTFRHELKSPLTILTQAANTIQRRLEQEGLISRKKPLPSRIANALADLDAVGSRLSLVTSYLTFDAHELVREQNRSKVFNEIIAPVTTFSSSYAKKRGRTIDVRHETLTGYSIYCDAGSVSMAFHMILDNAIKYSNKDTTIVVSGSHSNDYFGIRVQSTGTAIGEDERKNIFLKYYRGREAQDQKIEGSGIGLYLASEIIRLNGGTIVLLDAESSVIFEMRLPNLKPER
jgi:signal transduction histidine kinase